tara:strand:- start:623 stop:958 length:336 start_codon:yes stop_codon:yes gene_type:complete
MSGTYYITNVYLGYWPITRPKRSKEKSVYAAQNQVCMALLADRGVTPPPNTKFRTWLFKEHGYALLDEARQYIGVTTEVELEGKMPREFRRAYCTPRPDDEKWPSLMGGEC